MFQGSKLSLGKAMLTPKPHPALCRQIQMSLLLPPEGSCVRFHKCHTIYHWLMQFSDLKVEMGLDLSSIRYVVFDEADRLFEIGFAAQLSEILHALPQSSQKLLFSATLPSSLVEFARAGLQEPSLVRLDAESKISPDLQSAFFIMKGAEKEGALLHVLSVSESSCVAPYTLLTYER